MDCFSALVGLSALLSFLVGCEPNLIVGKWSCQGASGEGNVPATAPVDVPWSTSFENEFCDYTAAGGYCYKDARATYDVVSAPTHSGDTAAAFTLVADGAFNGLQARCVRRGELPQAAYYSAYFFVPEAPTAATNWNLMHFRSGTDAAAHGLWDLSLARQANGAFQLSVYDFFAKAVRPTANLPDVPIGEWFQLTAYLSRSAEATGELAVYQDGELGLRLTDLVTDDGEYGQWYVGNLAVSLTPGNNVIYVDDVAIRDTL